jgi:hypothetical protein
MRTSKDPLEPLRNWKELFLGERTVRKSPRARRRTLAVALGSVGHVHAHAGE